MVVRLCFMRPENVDQILAEKIRWVTFSKLKRGHGSLDKFDGMYVIIVREDDSPDEQKISLAHELAHIYFGLQDSKHLRGGLNEREFMVSEILMEAEGKIFCERYPEYMEELYEYYRELDIFNKVYSRFK